MADNGYRLIHEITDVVATATEFGYRQATGEQIPWHEQANCNGARWSSCVQSPNAPHTTATFNTCWASLNTHCRRSPH